MLAKICKGCDKWIRVELGNDGKAKRNIKANKDVVVEGKSYESC